MALMVVNNFNLGWACLSVRPFITDTPLMIDANGVLPYPDNFFCLQQCFAFSL